MKAFVRVAFAVAVLALASPAAARGDLSPADLAALKTYALSMDKVNAMQAAMDEAKKMPAMAGKMRGPGSDAKTIAEMEARIAAMPQAMALYGKHGLSAHDAVVMPFVLMDAGMCVLYPTAAPKLADRTSPAQIAFYKQHQAELKKIRWVSGGQ